MMYMNEYNAQYLADIMHLLPNTWWDASRHPQLMPTCMSESDEVKAYYIHIDCPIEGYQIWKDSPRFRVVSHLYTEDICFESDSLRKVIKWIDANPKSPYQISETIKAMRSNLKGWRYKHAN